MGGPDEGKADWNEEKGKSTRAFGGGACAGKGERDITVGSTRKPLETVKLVMGSIARDGSVRARRGYCLRA